MTQEKITLSVRPRGQPPKKLPEEITVPSTSQTKTLYTTLSTLSKLSPHRLRITKGSDGSFIPSSTSTLIQSTGLRHQSTIYVKDLGPQIAWRTVFLVEYLGPIIIHPLLYTFLTRNKEGGKVRGREGEGASYLQTLTLIMVLVHFVKRELETLFVHRFSADTMPARNIIKNSAHYWLLAGANMAYWIYQPSAAAAQESNNLITYAGLALFVLGELGNFVMHIEFRLLRSPGGKERGIPKHWAFKLVTCPNYMFESLAWVGIALVSWSLSTVLFLVVAVAQMGVWAKKKEVRYRREFGAQYKKKRFYMLPGIW